MWCTTTSLRLQPRPEPRAVCREPFSDLETSLRRTRGQDAPPPGETLMYRRTLAVALPILVLSSGARSAEGRPSALDSIAGPSNEVAGTGAPELSTRELRSELAAKRALILDARSPAEFATGHLPGALNVAGKPGLPPSQYTSDLAPIEKLVKGNREQPIILYCNGLYCGRSRRLADDLLAAGFTNVHRYQLGMPVWRALGGVQQIELPALLQVLEKDHSAVLLDARGGTTLPGARPLALSDVRKAKDDGRLPMDDHHTRILVVGASPGQAQELAEGVAKDAFDNIAFFAGDPTLVERALEDALQKRAKEARLLEPSPSPRPRVSRD